MWKTLKNIIKSEKTGIHDFHNVDFEFLDITVNCNLTDNFNTFFIKSIERITTLIEETNDCSTDINYNIVAKDILEFFEEIDSHKVERIIKKLPHKKGSTDDIKNNILRACVHVINDELTFIINESMRKGTCPES